MTHNLFLQLPHWVTQCLKLSTSHTRDPQDQASPRALHLNMNITPMELHQEKCLQSINGTCTSWYQLVSAGTLGMLNHYQTVFKQPHRAWSGFSMSFCAPAVPWCLVSLWCAQKSGIIAIVSSSLMLCILFCLCFLDSWTWQQKENICQEHVLEEEDFNTEEKLERW